MRAAGRAAGRSRRAFNRGFHELDGVGACFGLSRATAAECADSPWNVYSTETSPLPLCCPQLVLRLRFAHMREDDRIDVVEIAVAHEPRFRAELLFPSAPAKAERSGNGLHARSMIFFGTSAAVTS